MNKEDRNLLKQLLDWYGVNKTRRTIKDDKNLREIFIDYYREEETNEIIAEEVEIKYINIGCDEEGRATANCDNCNSHGVELLEHVCS